MELPGIDPDGYSMVNSFKKVKIGTSLYRFRILEIKIETNHIGSGLKTGSYGTVPIPKPDTRFQ